MKIILPALLVATLLVTAGCGSSSSSSSSSPAASSSSAGAPSGEGGGTLAADAKSAATGDIPDSQNFLTFSAPKLRISMVYPEGWTVQETGSSASIREKNNLIRITLAGGTAPTTASVASQLATLKGATPGLTAGTPQTITLKSGPAVKVVYSTKSAPNPVTGKQVTLNVVRYAMAHGGRVAIVDLGTPVGVDNVDAYKRMIESFKWL
jgi:hypothetical protein